MSRKSGAISSGGGKHVYIGQLRMFSPHQRERLARQSPIYARVRLHCTQKFGPSFSVRLAWEEPFAASAATLFSKMKEMRQRRTRSVLNTLDRPPLKRIFIRIARNFSLCMARRILRRAVVYGRPVFQAPADNNALLSPLVRAVEYIRTPWRCHKNVMRPKPIPDRN